MICVDAYRAYEQINTSIYKDSRSITTVNLASIFYATPSDIVKIYALF